MARDAKLPLDSPQPPGGVSSSAGGPHERGASGDVLPLGLDIVVAEHHVALYRYAYRLTGSVHDAEDLTQQTFLVAREKISQVRDAELVRGWLCTVLRNCYLKGFRRRVPISQENQELSLDEVAEEVVESPIDGEQLQAALGQLPDDFRLVLLMYYFEESSYREIADALAIPLGTVMSRLARAKNHLRRLLQPQSSETAPIAEKPPIAEKTGQPVQPASGLAETRPETETSLLPFPSGPIATRR